MTETLKDRIIVLEQKINSLEQELKEKKLKIKQNLYQSKTLYLRLRAI